MNQKKPATQPGSDVEKFVVRLPQGMRGRIAEVASRNHRSMNSEIVSRLEQSLSQSGAGDEAERHPGIRSEPALSAVRDQPGGSDEQARLLFLFARLSPAQRGALLRFLEED